MSLPDDRDPIRLLDEVLPHRGSCHITFRTARNLDHHLRRLADSRAMSYSALIRRLCWEEVRQALLQGEI